MYSLSCASMGDASCDFVAKGETQEEVMQKMMEHMKTAHADKAAEMESKSPEEMEAMKAMAMSKMVQE